VIIKRDGHVEGVEVRVVEDARQEREADGGEHAGLAPEDARAEQVDQEQQRPAHEHGREAMRQRVALEQVEVLVQQPRQREGRLGQRGVLVVVVPRAVHGGLLERGARSR
jgi:hypothetical protein